MAEKNFRIIKRGTFIGFLFFSFCLIMLDACQVQNESEDKTSQNSKSLYTGQVRDYYLGTLDSLSYYANQLDTSNTREENQVIFPVVRKWYKYAEPIMIGSDYTNYLTLNGPNLPIVHAEDYTEIKVLKPRSLQVIEELLFTEDIYDKQEFYDQLLFLQSRVPFIAHNHLILDQYDRHYLKMIRDAIVTIAVKGITGFDSPATLNSLEEAAFEYESIKNMIHIFESAFHDKQILAAWDTELNQSIEILNKGSFNEFDRYEFIKNHTNSQLELVAKTAKDWKIALAENRPLNPNATNLFQQDFLQESYFASPLSPALTADRIALGKTLFNDKNLSVNKDMSCASCHDKSLAFSDGLKKAVGIGGKELLRNSPTLKYASLQKSFFWDARAHSLESQIFNVVNNEDEFHSNFDNLKEYIQNNASYKSKFDSLYNGKMDNSTIKTALSMYIRSLSPFDSKFDRNMQGTENTLSDEEITGFNLFMGKAACATCHFPPSFNGTVPPKYVESELENIGTTQDANFSNPKLDPDLGAYYPYEVNERSHFFKTPTIRNVEITAPYMHNGGMATLEEIIDFYDAGGAQGLGLENEYQTLPADSLLLSQTEKQAIISFLKTLTDKELESH